MPYCPRCGGLIGPETGYICSHCYRILTGYDAPEYHANTYANTDYLPDTYIGGGRPEQKGKTQRDEPIKDADKGGRMEMTAAREGAILGRAIDKYGSAVQRRQMIEEMAELTQALCKTERMAPSPYYGTAWINARDHVLEEIADVQIMLNQMQLLYGDCTEWKIKKLEQLAKRLGMEGFDGGAE